MTIQIIIVLLIIFILLASFVPYCEPYSDDGPSQANINQVAKRHEQLLQENSDLEKKNIQLAADIKDKEEKLKTSTDVGATSAPAGDQDGVKKDSECTTKIVDCQDDIRRKTQEKADVQQAYAEYKENVREMLQRCNALQDQLKDCQKKLTDCNRGISDRDKTINTLQQEKAILEKRCRTIYY
jgi:cell division septum initiation protein DivIVA